MLQKDTYNRKKKLNKNKNSHKLLKKSLIYGWIRPQLISGKTFAPDIWEWDISEMAFIRALEKERRREGGLWILYFARV